MNGLLSSSIEFLPYQVAAAKKVLEDPILRYLLADEVGLGKTIEAGIIIRQVMIDNPRASILVVVPQNLISQWREELGSRFHIDFDTDNLILKSHEEADKPSFYGRYDLIVIDEAHHVAEWYCNGDTGLEARFNKVRKLVHDTKGLLLLTATPGLYNEKAFLSILNLLDPGSFRLEDLDKFRLLNKKREEVSKSLFALNTKSPDFIIKPVVSTLNNLFENELSLQPVLEDLKAYFDSGRKDADERNEIIAKLRTSIIERYRVSRRIIRTRRSDVWKVQRRRPIEEYGECEIEELLIGKLHHWRLDALSHCGDSISFLDSYRQLYFLLCSALNDSYRLFKALLLARSTGKQPSSLKEDFTNNELELLELPLFATEKDTLLELIDLISSVEGSDVSVKEQMLIDRLEILKAKSESLKVVVFASFSSTAKNIGAIVRQKFGVGSTSSIFRTMAASEAESEIKNFKQDDQRWILVTDKSGEEGLNLQFADHLIHFDLPYSPNRIEQRIGRLDRIGQRNSVKSFILLGSVEDVTLNPLASYFKYLDEGLGIFRRSINGISILLEQIVPEFLTFLFEQGGNLDSNTLQSMLVKVKAEVEEEEVKVHQQHMLDLFIDNIDDYTRYFEQVESYEHNFKQLFHQVQPWITEALLFKFNGGTKEGKYSWTPRTLLPVGLMGESGITTTEFQGSFERGFAAAERCPIFRSGHPFIDLVSENFDWDDRGKA
ncbi:MAG: hypothetical protein EOP48_14145, partial [Sphingobacteriales bacterium]